MSIGDEEYGWQQSRNSIEAVFDMMDKGKREMDELVLGYSRLCVCGVE